VRTGSAQKNAAVFAPQTARNFAVIPRVPAEKNRNFVKNARIKEMLIPLFLHFCCRSPHGGAWIEMMCSFARSIIRCCRSPTGERGLKHAVPCGSETGGESPMPSASIPQPADSERSTPYPALLQAFAQGLQELFFGSGDNSAAPSAARFVRAKKIFKKPLTNCPRSAIMYTYKADRK
jgi:hypothetical protein